MATLPLYSMKSAPDAWHRVRSPGGYEWWYFDAEDPRYDRQIVAILFEGFVFHPGYLRAWGRYSRKPTRVAPPMPASYPCAYFVVYESGRPVAQFMTQYSPGDFLAAMDAPSVQVGPNRIAPQDGGLEVTVSGTPWKLTARGPKLLEHQLLSARFVFRPLLDHAMVTRDFLSRRLAGADHKWVIANPLCEVSGSIDIGDQTTSFQGRGYHDHNFGTGPLGTGLRRWIWGRILFDDWVRTFHYAIPRDRALSDEIHLIHVDSAQVTEIAVDRIEADWSARTGLLLRYPRRLALSDGLVLTNPRVVDPTPFYLRLTYDAQCGQHHGQAFCEVAYPDRLRWPVLGRMIEMSVDKRPCRGGEASPLPR